MSSLAPSYTTPTRSRKQSICLDQTAPKLEASFSKSTDINAYVKHLEELVAKLKEDNATMMDAYERKIDDLKIKLERSLTQSLLDDVEVLKDAFSTPDLNPIDNDVSLDSNTQQWLFSELISRQKRLPVSKIIEANTDTSRNRSSVGTGIQGLREESGLNGVLNEVLKKNEAKAREDVIQSLNGVNDWKYSVFSFERISQGQPLLLLGYHFLSSQDVIKNLGLPPNKVVNFLAAIQSRYHDQNPYHNRMHAADVLHASYYLMSLDDGINKQFTPMDRLILYFSAAIHDFDHPGVNNNFMINTASSQAILYNDKSVLENHHIAAAFLVYDNENNNFLSHIGRDEYKQFRSSVIDVVLATDLSLHFGFVTLFKSKLNDPSQFQPFGKAEDKLLFFKIIMKCADVNHPARFLDVHLKWSRRCFDEFFRQGDEEKRLGIPVSPFMDRETTKLGGAQLGFIEFICLPVFEALDTYMPLGVVIENLRANRNYWKGKKEDEDRGNSFTFPASSNEDE